MVTLNISGLYRGSTNRGTRMNNGQRYPTQEAAEQATRDEAGLEDPGLSAEESAPPQTTCM
jgi:hypothetical protein